MLTTVNVVICLYMFVGIALSVTRLKESVLYQNLLMISLLGDFCRRTLLMIWLSSGRLVSKAFWPLDIWCWNSHFSDSRFLSKIFLYFFCCYFFWWNVVTFKIAGNCQLVGPSVRRSVGPSVGRSVGRPVSQSVSHRNEANLILLQTHVWTTLKWKPSVSARLIGAGIRA